MFCKSCGEQLLDGVRFCTKCGTAVGATPATQQPPAMPAQQAQPLANSGTPRKKNTKRNVLIIAVAMVVVVIGAVVFLSELSTDSPTRHITPEMVRIYDGTFMMGSPANEPERIDNETQHQVTISSAFYMGKYEVTQKEYQAVMGNNPSHFNGDNLPVECVSWYDAVKYCNKLSKKEGLTPAYTIIGTNVTWNRKANGYRLPTEAEWEYACRAGTTTAYNTGATISDDTGWYDDNSGDTTYPVGQKPANKWGLYDMHGNVWEWCWDWYGDYARMADPAEASSGSYRVIRGGSWVTSAGNARSAFRDYITPTYRYNALGFRLARNGN